MVKKGYKNIDFDWFSIKTIYLTNFPDFRCSDRQFTCKNGQCVKKNLRCDGDFACKDESDEDDCECPSSMLGCHGGGCVLATNVCDRKIDCSNGDDENNCRKCIGSFDKGIGFHCHIPKGKIYHINISILLVH